MQKSTKLLKRTCQTFIKLGILLLASAKTSGLHYIKQKLEHPELP